MQTASLGSLAKKKEGSKQIEKEINEPTILPLLTKHIEFEKCVDPFS